MSLTFEYHGDREFIKKCMQKCNFRNDLWVHVTFLCIGSNKITAPGQVMRSENGWNLIDDWEFPA